MFENIQLQSDINEDTEFIPMLTLEEEDTLSKDAYPTQLPILPLRNTVLFPGVVIPITLGRDKSIKLIQEAYKGNKIVGVVAQMEDKAEEPTFDQLHQVGTIANVIKVIRMPNGNTTVILQGKRRFKIEKQLNSEPYFTADISIVDDEVIVDYDDVFDATMSSIKDAAQEIIKLSPHIPTEAGIAIRNIDSPSFLINFIASNMQAGVNDKQVLLQLTDIKTRATELLKHLAKDLQKVELKNSIQNKTKVDLDKQQRDYFLQQQLKTIQEELGNKSNEEEANELETRAKTMKWSDAIGATFKKELDKLRRMNPVASEYSVQSNYLELLLDLPWGEYSNDSFDLKNAQKILDDDHFGLTKIKQRIIEHLAVLKLKGNMKSPILLLHGPPGVGKTSLARSIARALNREYIRMSLGGMRDESEIRGHRKTYIGAMPGRILQNLKKVKVSNPVFLLDEIDKLGQGFQGDPSSALLEVLDPEQNKAFYDNFVEIEFDLSNVMFIATANSLQTIQPALLDRMEVINISGYTLEEKVQIAKKHLLPKQLEEHGLAKKAIDLNEKVLQKIIASYTRESGVRALEKRIAKVVRNEARKIAMDEPYTYKPTEEDITETLGSEMITREKYQDNSIAGVVTGLAWTSVGGEILFIESSISRGKGGKLTLTGNLGDVMKESAVLALEYIKTHADDLGINYKVFDQYNLHLHVPEGATPKDGPSAGITMLTAIASVFTQRKVRSKLAMTGEITLRGKVLPVGGIKEKILAAKRAGIKEIILCDQNEKDILDIEPEYLRGLSFYYVNTMAEVLDIALLNERVKNPLQLIIDNEK
ncbi:MAG: endopeptidase La [Bacteroidia bacterium]|nr:endopeptidase La [Bacteroidia bacterium]